MCRYVATFLSWNQVKICGVTKFAIPAMLTHNKTTKCNNYFNDICIRHSRKLMKRTENHQQQNRIAYICSCNGNNVSGKRRVDDEIEIVITA